MIRIGSALCVASVLLAVTNANAATETRVKYIVPIPYMGTIEVDSAKTVVTAIRALESIEDWSLGSGADYRVKRSHADRRVIRIQPKVAKPATTTFQFLAGGQWFTIELRRAHYGNKPISDLIFVPTEEDIPTEDPPTASLPSTRTPVQDYLSFVANEAIVTRPVQLSWRERGHSIQVAVGAMRWSEDYLIFRFQMHNQGSYPYPIASLTMTDLHDAEHETILFPRTLDAGEYHLESGGNLVGALRISKAAALRAGWKMHLQSSPAVPAASVIWRASDEFSSRRGPIEDRLVVSVHAAGGAANLDDGIGLARKAWTSSQVVGARVLYGVMKHVSVEGALDFSRTSSAVFNDVTWGTEQGNLEAYETSGRLQIGGLLHTAGKRWIPYARLGLGVQLSRHSAGMGTRVESETRSALIFGLGGGVNVRMGKRLVAGASFVYANSIGSGPPVQAFEGGVHLGASWDLGNDWD